MSDTTVHLLRHGEVHNPDGILYGRLPDFHLSETGRRMADDAARALARRPVVVLRSSPLERAQETAAPVAAALGLDVSLDERLLESTNVFEGTALGPEQGWRDPRHWHHLVNPLRPSWGEDYRAIADRVLAAVRDVRDEVRRTGEPGAEGLCVLHQLPIWVATRAAQGRRLWHHPGIRLCGLASVTSITWGSRGVGTTGGDDAVVRVAYGEPAGAASRTSAPAGA